MTNYLRPIYWYIRKIIFNNSFNRKSYLKNNYRKDDYDSKCPVCFCKESKIINFVTESIQVEKNLCKQCGHLYSEWLNNSLENAKKLFNYESDNINNLGQKNLILKTIAYSKIERGNFLDFGVGGNMSSYSNLSTQHNIFGCDIVERNDKNYFVTYQNSSMLNSFDGISSNAVIEHLYNTHEAWIYLNRLLKPMSEGGGIMIHAFPSQIDFDFQHWSIQIKSHVCLFSKNSIEKICKVAGFELIKIEYDYKIQHPVHYFKKIQDV